MNYNYYVIESLLLRSGGCTGLSMHDVVSQGFADAIMCIRGHLEAHSGRDIPYEELIDRCHIDGDLHFNESIPTLAFSFAGILSFGQTVNANDECTHYAELRAVGGQIPDRICDANSWI